MMQYMTALLFDNFETLDLFGPIEMFGRLSDKYAIQFCSMDGGIIKNTHGVSLPTIAISDLHYSTDILLIIGGQGTRHLVDNERFLQVLKKLSNDAKWVLSVCTGSALLAKAGLLDNKQATSNKRAWDWVILQSNKVHWINKARWVVDGKYYTSSGVSAGMDMALGFIADRLGTETALKISQDVEYRWISNSTLDEFSQNINS